jgi:hypothetical protein
MAQYLNEPTGRIDTTVTQVAVRRGDSTSTLAAAARHVKTKFPGSQILAIWSAKVRDDRGNPVFNVEWWASEEVAAAWSE